VGKILKFWKETARDTSIQTWETGKCRKTYYRGMGEEKDYNFSAVQEDIEKIGKLWLTLRRETELFRGIKNWTHSSPLSLGNGQWYIRCYGNLLQIKHTNRTFGHLLAKSRAFFIPVPFQICDNQDMLDVLVALFLKLEPFLKTKTILMG